MITMKKKYEKQKGVALLFAIGILSLLMITGLAFVTNSVLSRKTAYNNRSRSQAKMLAQSAISRSMLAIMMQQYAMYNASEWPSEFSEVYSYAKYDANGVETAPNMGTAFEDQLTGSKSLLKFPHWKYSKDEYKDLIKDEKYKDRAKWVFLYDSSDTNKRKIIGRIAYQVLPPGKEQLTINMSVALSGSKPDPTNEKYPFKQRLGVGVEELNFDSVKAISNPDTWSSIFGLTAAGEVAPELYSTLYGMLGIDASATERRNWIEGWLAEGGNLVEPEVFVGGKEQTRYYRFNISAAGEDWEKRFSSAENSEYRITEIVAGGKKYHFLTAEKSAKGGIPFFKRIGDNDDKGKSGFGSLENFRKQIVANFNDYCDKDHIPTSDVDAGRWGSDNLWNIPAGVSYNSSLSKEPDYTGNESTPYIYGLGFAGKFNTFALTPDRKGMTIGMDLTPAVKLVNIYPKLNSEYISYEQYIWLRQVGLDITVTKATANVSYSYTDSDGVAKTGTVSALEFDISNIKLPDFGPLNSTAASWEYDILDPDPVNHKKTITGTSGSGKVSIPFAKTDFTANNYAHKVSASAFKLSDKTISFEGGKTLLALGDFAVSTPFYDKVKGAAEASMGEGYTEFTVTDVQEVALKEVALKFFIYPGRMTLMGKYNHVGDDGSSAEKTVGVDMVKSLVPHGIADAEKWKITTPLTATDGVFPADFMLGTLEGRDPRANLLWKMWKKQDHFELASSPLNWSFMNPDGGNSEAPNSIAAEDGDRESAAEPAWKGDAINQHLSTAFIRNAPMRSPWELGLIHRAAPWQTINIKKACSPSGLPAIGPEDHDPIRAKWAAAGTSYGGGDGGILNEIKMTDKINSAGKVDLNVLYKLSSSQVSTLALDQDIVKALFVNVPYNQQIAVNGSYGTPRLFSDLFMEKSTYTAEEEGKKAKLPSENILTSVNNSLLNVFAPASPADVTFNNRAHFLEKQNSSLAWSNLGGGFSAETDAALEEIIGKTINLVDASNEAALPSVIYVQIVAQTIRDIEGTGIVRLKKDGTPMTPVDCSLGKFDARRQSDGSKTLAENGSDNIYYDEITGEVKLLATLIRDPLTGKISLRAIEYID